MKKQITHRDISKLMTRDIPCGEIEPVMGHDEEIVVHWVNKYGVPMDIKTRKGGLIHALWLAEHEKRTRQTSDIRPLTSDIEIQPEILSIDEQHSS